MSRLLPPALKECPQGASLAVLWAGEIGRKASQALTEILSPSHSPIFCDGEDFLEWFGSCPFRFHPGYCYHTQGSRKFLRLLTQTQWGQMWRASLLTAQTWGHELSSIPNTPLSLGSFLLFISPLPSQTSTSSIFLDTLLPPSVSSCVLHISHLPECSGTQQRERDQL